MGSIVSIAASSPLIQRVFRRAGFATPIRYTDDLWNNPPANISVGDLVHSAYYDSDKISGSGVKLKCVALAQTPPDASSGVNSDGFIYSASSSAAKWEIAENIIKDIHFGCKCDGTNEQDALQAAVQYAWDSGKKLLSPKSGVSYVDGLVLDATDLDERDHEFQWEGKGYGEIFALGQTSGRVIRRSTEGKVFYINDPSGSTRSAGTLFLKNLFFDGDSDSNPIVHLEAFYGHSIIERVLFYQRGQGDGLQVDYTATAEIRNCYAVNSDFVSAILGTARTGRAFYFPSDTDAGLLTLTKCTSRGFRTGFVIGDADSGHIMYNTKLVDCESSTCYNGMHITNAARNTNIDNHYFEGGDGGTGILDEGHYTLVHGCNMFAGFGIGIDARAVTRGNKYVGNTLSAGSVAGTKLLTISDSSIGKTVRDNTFVFGGSGGSITGVVAIEITGSSPHLDLTQNTFDPFGAWTGGAGTTKINDASTGGGIVGLVSAYDGGKNIPWLSRGAASFDWGTNTLSQGDVSGNELSIPLGTAFNINASSTTTVNTLNVGGKDGRFLIINLLSNNMTIADTGRILLNDNTNFSGPGIIMFITREVGGLTYAYEISRTSL